jgi:hypothetical protein
MFYLFVAGSCFICLKTSKSQFVRSGKLCSFCSTIGNPPGTLVTNHVISHVISPFNCNHISAAPACNVYLSQFVRYSRACGSYHDFLDKGFLLTRKLLNLDGLRTPS